MTTTFAFIGNRSDLGALVASAHHDALQVQATPPAGVAWGVGFFQGDQVLLQRKPTDPRVHFSLAEEIAEIRSHALLAQASSLPTGSLRTETTPPLRLGHLLFCCHGSPQHGVPELRSLIKDTVPEFVSSHLPGETFTDLAFALFLAELPRPELTGSWSDSTRPRLTTWRPPALARALRRTLDKLRELTQTQALEPFHGDLWVTTGEHLLLVHQQGPLGLRLYRGRADFESLLPSDAEVAASLDLSHLTLLLHGPAPLPIGWERLPDSILLTASRTQAPEIESLS